MDLIPGASQLKSFVQLACGDKEGAKQTQKNFLKRCPGVSQVTSAVQLISGDVQGAWETQKEFGKVVNGMADATPGVGHVKGLVHYAFGDEKGGDNALKASSRSTLVMGGGIGGFLVGGPVGAAAGGAYGGLLADTAITAVTDEPHGTIATLEQLSRNPKDGGLYVDLIGGVAMDAVTGHAAGNTWGKKIENKLNDGNPAPQKSSKPLSGSENGQKPGGGSTSGSARPPKRRLGPDDGVQPKRLKHSQTPGSGSTPGSDQASKTSSAVTSRTPKAKIKNVQRSCKLEARMTEGHTLLQMEEYAHEGGTLVRRRFGISFDEESSSSSSIDTRSDMRSSSNSIGARPDMRSNDVYQERPFHNDPSPSVMREDARFLQMEEYAHEDVTLVRRRFGISFDEESSSSSSIDTRSDMRSSSSSIGARPDMRSNDVYQERPFHNDPSPSVMREDARSFQIIEPNRRGNVYLQRPLQEFPPRYIRTVPVPEVPVPEYLTVDWVRATAVRLRWRLPDGTSENQYKFRISCHSEAADPLTVETIDQSYWAVIRFLRPATEYIINVFTLTQCGRRSQSCTKIIHTGQNDADIQREKEKTLQAIDAIPAWGKEMLRRSQNGSEPEPDFRRRDAGRGHHVINNAMLSILTDVLKKVLHRLKFPYDSSDLERLSKYLEYDFNSSARNDIQNVMVAHIRTTNNGDLPADLNSSLFGFHSLILTEVMCMDMINLITGSDRCPRDLSMSPKLHWIIEEIMMRMSYVDKIAKDHWIRNCADRTNKFKVRKADVERHLRCGLKHFKTIIGELQNIYRNGLPISCCLP